MEKQRITAVDAPLRLQATSTEKIGWQAGISLPFRF